jgi:hypothetical protein
MYVTGFMSMKESAEDGFMLVEAHKKGPEGWFEGHGRVLLLLHDGWRRYHYPDHCPSEFR